MQVFLLQHTKMDLGGRISRKLDFIPPLATVLTGGWQPDTKAIAEAQVRHFERKKAQTRTHKHKNESCGSYSIGLFCS
jgi:hypothetical protein